MGLGAGFDHGDAVGDHIFEADIQLRAIDTFGILL
jgi:hypothetical protein